MCVCWEKKSDQAEPCSSLTRPNPFPFDMCDEVTKLKQIQLDDTSLKPKHPAKIVVKMACLPPACPLSRQPFDTYFV